MYLVVVVVVVRGCGFPTTWCLGLRHRKSKHSWGKRQQQPGTVEAPRPGTLMHKIALLSASPVCTACLARSSYSYPVVATACRPTVQARPCSTTNTRRRVSPDHQVTLQSERIPKDHETWQSTSSNHGHPEVGSWIPHGRQPGEDSCEGTVNQGYCSWESTAATWGGTYTDTANHRKRWSTHA